MLHALILAGGRGTRFWPRSRMTRPKQLQAVAGPRTMLRETLNRVRPLVPPERVLVATGRALAQDIRAELPEIPSANLLVEPVGRNTAPCIALAASVLVRRDPEAVMVVLPADHVVARPGEFRRIVRAAASLAAREDCLIPLGIRPTRPETGYGYLQMGKECGRARGLPYFRVRRFVEKPDLATAQRYLRSGRHFWNSGMFVFGARTVLAAVREFLPETFDGCERIADGGIESRRARLLARIFPALPSISIDYGVMEKANNLLGFVSEMGWSDMGSWASLAEVLPADAEGNVAVGDLLPLDGRGLIVHAPGKLVAAVGVEDLVIVDSPDALLVCAKDATQRVKDVVELLEKRGRRRLL